MKNALDAPFCLLPGGGNEDKFPAIDTHPNLLILRASGKVVAVRAETHTADIKIARLARVFVNQHAVIAC